jgi:hypothetical protein
VSTDGFELARAEEMLRGYSARWYDEPLDVLGVELEFDVPLVNPETGADSRTFRRGGKIDVLVRRRDDGRVLVYDAKTSSEDITSGSVFWKRLRLNTQASGYIHAARELGFGEPWGACWDVLGKPSQRPCGVPILEDGAKVVLDAGGMRVRTKDGKKWRETADSAQGFVLQTRPETVDEYRVRVRDAICAEPDRYFARGEVVRLLEEEREAMFDAWQIAANIREGRRLGRWPRNPDSCLRYGQTCAMFEVCTGERSIDDPTRYRRVEHVHEELGARATKLPLLTNSELSTYRACTRLHHYRYDLGVRALDDGDDARFGTLCHRGLEGWWLQKKSGAPEDECLGHALYVMRTPKATPATTTPVTRQEISL